MTLPDLIDHLKTAPYHLDYIALYVAIASIVLLLIDLIIVEIKDKQLPNILTTITTISIIIPLVIAAYLAINHDYNSYTISRDKTHLYVNSHSDYLKSAKLKIIKNDEYFIYAKYGKNTYKIPSIPLKEKN